MEAKHLIESIIRALMFTAGILGNNWLAIASFPRQKSGIRTNEILFINLAISNLITNCLVDLPDTVADFVGRWFFGDIFCGVFRFCSDLSETSSILTTLFISVFWHQKLVGSLKRGGAQVQMDSLHLVGCLLAGSWTVSVVFSIPHFFFISVEGKNESHENCVDVFPNPVAQKTYEIIYLTMANAFPIAGILYASIQIVVSLLQNQRRIGSHFSHPTKERVKEENNSTVSGSGPINNVKGTPPGEPASSSLNGGLADNSPQASSLNTETDTNCRTGAQSRSFQMPSKVKPNSGIQVRAAKSVVAVASVVMVCWMTHLLLRITNNILTSSIVLEVASYIAASYTSIIPYIFLHGVKKLSCSCKK
ncbi:cysteinyl leukotriene receptor 1 [Melanotaenia boesemani]|uniref:cysteinyl leukotriene receptor 1 n=1 Tax=Melanotaenia boesemani TaxID=1250792 RepID=UPI001C045126|nr:cysteinyl leukotriene receptor 1 [Melanotaenia boesemani]